MRTDWLLLVNAMVGNFLSGLSARIFQISLPTVANGLGTDILGISWAMISYQLAGISLSILFGRLGDLYGRHVIYGLGFVVMTVSAFLCGLAGNVFQLIVFRFLQGVGGAMSQSAARVLGMEAMPEGSEGKANGLMTMAFHSGFLVGPPVGGLLIDYIGWRWTFFLLVPIGLIGIVLTVMRLRGSQARETRGRLPSVDYVGAGLFIVCMVMLPLLLDRRSAELVGLGQRGALMAFAGTFLGFLVHESRAPSPMVNLSLFRIRMFSFSVLSLLIISITHSLVGFLMPFYLQEILHLSPSVMGVIFLASPVFTITLATASGHISDHVGPRIPASIGVLLTVAAFGIGTSLRSDSPWLLPTAMMALLGLGTAFFNTPNQTAIIASVPKAYRGFATGMVHTIFGLGHMLGISVGGVLLTVMFQYYSGIPGATPSPDNPLAFVSSMNAAYLVCFGLGVAALFSSLMRGGARIAPRFRSADAGD